MRGSRAPVQPQRGQRGHCKGPAPSPVTFLCPSAPGACGDPRAGHSREGALGMRKLLILFPAQWYCLFPESKVVCPACCQETSFVNPDMGGKNTGFPSVPAAHIPVQRGPHHSRAGGLSGSPVSCKMVPEGPPAFAQNVGSHPWQVFLPRAPIAQELGQPEISALGGGSPSVAPPPDLSWP